MEATITKITSADLAGALPPMRAGADKAASEVKVPVKLFSPVGAATWWLTEYDPAEDLAFGYCDLGMGCAELGYVSITELREVTLPFGLCIERDIHWDPETTLEAVMAGEAR